MELLAYIRVNSFTGYVTMWLPNAYIIKSKMTWIECICIQWIENRLIPWIQNKEGKYYIHKVVAGTIQLVKLSLSFSIHIKNSSTG